MKFLITLFLALFTFFPVQSQSGLIDGYTDALIRDFQNSTTFCFDQTGEVIFVAERAGKVFVGIWNGSSYDFNPDPIIDISDQVTDYFERGLLSIAWHEDKIWLYYSVEESYLWPEEEPALNSATINRVSRFSVDVNNNTSELLNHPIGEIVSEGIASTAGNHQGGSIIIDENGVAYLSTGDGASGTYNADAIAKGIMRPELDLHGKYRSQIIDCSNGKIFRFDADTGDAIAENPFYDPDNVRSHASRMYAMGFRNPFRMWLHNGVLYVGDVGAGSREEITVIDKAGLNAGWGRHEGFELYSFSSTVINPDEGVPFTDLIFQATSFIDSTDATKRRFKHHPPEITYRHGNDMVVEFVSFGNDGLSPLTLNQTFSGNSITGGIVVVGDALGEELNGAYVFADYTRSWIQVVYPADGDRWLGQTFALAEDGFSQIVCFRQSPLDGSLWIMKLNGNLIQITYEDTLSLQEVSKISDYPYGLNYVVYNEIGQKLASGTTHQGWFVEIPKNVRILLDVEGYLVKKMHINQR